MGSGAASPLLLRTLALCLLVLPLPVAPSTAVPTPSPSVLADGATTGPPPEGSPSAAPTAGVPSPTPETSQSPAVLGEETPASESSASPSELPRSSPAATRGPSRPASPTVTPRPGPWPQPVTDVAKLCACDLWVDRCDINCCCDPTCTAADFSLFTACSIPVVTNFYLNGNCPDCVLGITSQCQTLKGDSQLCRQQEALYSIDTSVYPPKRTSQLVDKVNPSVFCIQTVNYKAALSFQPPEIPTLENFDRLLQDYGGITFSTETDLMSSVESETRSAANAGETSRYEYRDPIETADGFLWLPAPLFSQCSDSNPAGFLMNQVVKCNRMIEANECTTIPALSMEFYTNSSILPVPKSSRRVNITIQSVTVQTLQGLRTRLASSALLLPELEGQACSNVVLEALYLITFTEAGEISGVAVSLVLATINMASGFIRQSFEIRFIPQNTRPVVLLSGNPGYVVGLPIRAGFRSPGSGIIQTTDEDGQLTMLKSTSAQDCLAVEGIRTPILFGYNMMSGCQLRITNDADCLLLAPALLNMLKGQNFPDCVASFGNSEPQNGLDWVQIVYNVSQPGGCEIPVRFEIEVKWTKYGSLLNPQAKLTSVTVTVVTGALPQVDPGSERTILILSAVTFVDVSAPAEPGYKSRPTVEAKLPFDFFFPFV